MKISLILFLYICTQILLRSLNWGGFGYTWYLLLDVGRTIGEDIRILVLSRSYKCLNHGFRMDDYENNCKDKLFNIYKLITSKTFVTIKIWRSLGIEDL